MIRLGWLLLGALCIGAAAAWLLRSDSGYVLLSYNDWVVESSIGGFALAVLASLAALWLIVKLVTTTVRLPSAVRARLERRRMSRARRFFLGGLREMALGHWRPAETLLLRNVAHHEAPDLNYLFAARAAQRQGEAERRDRYLGLASMQADATPLSILLTQAELSYESRDYAKARQSLQKLHANDASHRYVIRLLAECLNAIGEYDELLGLLAEAHRNQIPETPRQRELRKLALRHLIDQAASAGDLDTLRSVWQRATPDERVDATVRLAYVDALLRLGVDAEAQTVIDEALDKDWDADLVDRFGRLKLREGVSQLASVEQWLQRYGDRPDLLLTAGRACINAQLWGKAAGYLSAAETSLQTPAVYWALVQLAEASHDTEAAQRWARKGIEAAARL